MRRYATLVSALKGLNFPGECCINCAQIGPSEYALSSSHCVNLCGMNKLNKMTENNSETKILWNLQKINKSRGKIYIISMKQ